MALSKAIPVLEKSIPPLLYSVLLEHRNKGDSILLESHGRCTANHSEAIYVFLVGSTLFSELADWRSLIVIVFWWVTELHFG
ncbi:unnamed protein product [Ceratitis capitata]|uniref:(Mediterranean fruit fly) hypothetical protein n=1 Tax=Ceratitis capitata TaxID=7213 RepID=A0A811UTV0_CERCA|nr:unnamed protein product [Ceratitis capitata]